MKSLILLPPIAFGIYLLVIWLIFKLTSVMSPGTTCTGAKAKPYACGEEFPSAKVEPDYSRFFPFAIFFTLIHVAGLMIATLALTRYSTGHILGVIYLLGVGLALSILLKGRENT